MFLQASVILLTGGGSTWHHPPGPGADTPPPTPPPGPGTPPGTRYTPPGPGTLPPPWDQVHPPPPGTRYTPLDQVHPPRTRYTPAPDAEHAERYGQWAGGTHPTGMQSCWFHIFVFNSRARPLYGYTQHVEFIVMPLGQQTSWQTFLILLTLSRGSHYFPQVFYC